jgi:hypothetical protein
MHRAPSLGSLAGVVSQTLEGYQGAGEGPPAHPHLSQHQKKQSQCGQQDRQGEALLEP